MLPTVLGPALRLLVVLRGGFSVESYRLPSCSIFSMLSRIPTRDLSPELWFVYQLLPLSKCFPSAILSPGTTSSIPVVKLSNLQLLSIPLFQHIPHIQYLLLTSFPASTSFLTHPPLQYSLVPTLPPNLFSSYGPPPHRPLTCLPLPYTLPQPSP
jgi:hypothetical protein